MVRPSCCDKLNYNKRDRRDEDDAKIVHYVSSKHIPRKPGMKKCGKSCKVRWSNESFSSQEEELIIKLHAAVGSRWAIIAHQLPGRTDNDIKNHWNTKLRKKLTERGIDPVTHKPFSQILADYGKIGGLSRATGGSRYIGTIKRDLKKVASTLPKPEPSSSSYTFISNTHDNLNYENITTTTTTNNHSLDLLSQLQAISLVTEGTNSENYKVSFNNSSIDLSRGYENQGKVVKSPESFSWHDFLLDDKVRLVEEEQEFDDIGCILSSSKTQMPEPENNGYPIQGVSSTASLSSQASTFLEAMLDQENDMFLNFPGLMEDHLY
ncbi:hypothetical protein RND81_13G124000 [Saponaria officinalis]|uniref:Uncharacterized protein n=1 Tax=Saponaria officinalis TaxID=3572 RepID=A0AAW1H0P6_SAPOF